MRATSICTRPKHAEVCHTHAHTCVLHPAVWRQSEALVGAPCRKSTIALLNCAGCWIFAACAASLITTCLQPTTRTI